MNKLEFPQSYKNYQLEWVGGQPSDKQAAEILDLWAGVIDPPEAKRRLNEVMLCLRNQQGQLIGVTTAYTAPFVKPGQIYWYMRMYISPNERGVFGLARQAGSLTYAALAEQQANPAEGVMLVTENPKLWRPAIGKAFQEKGWRLLGRGPRGNLLWYQRFDNEAISPVPPGFEPVELG